MSSTSHQFVAFYFKRVRHQLRCNSKRKLFPIMASVKMKSNQCLEYRSRHSKPPPSPCRLPSTQIISSPSNSYFNRWKHFLKHYNICIHQSVQRIIPVWGWEIIHFIVEYLCFWIMENEPHSKLMVVVRYFLVVHNAVVRSSMSFWMDKLRIIVQEHQRVFILI